MRTSVFCRTCDQATLHETDPRPVNHLLHAVITLFLCGLWLPVWILAAMNSGGGALRCTKCGRTPPLTVGKIVSTAVAMLIMLVACGGGMNFIVNRVNTAVKKADQAKVAPPAPATPPGQPARPGQPQAAPPGVAEVAPAAETPQPAAPQKTEPSAEQVAERREKDAAGSLRAGKSLMGDARKRWLRNVVAKYPGTQAAAEAQTELDK